MDILTCDENGKPWDFDEPEQRKKCKERLIKEMPYLLIGSPMCTVFSIIQNLNLHIHRDDPVWLAKYEEAKMKAVKHVEFCVKIYRHQMSRGRYFLHEHPAGATSWELDAVKRIQEMDDVLKTTCDQCEYGLTTDINGTSVPAKKPTSFLTNSWKIAAKLSTRCSGRHNHGSLMEGRAKKAEEYPDRLCQSICQGLIEQKEYDLSLLCCTTPLNSIQVNEVLQNAGCPEKWCDMQHEDTVDDDLLQHETMLLKTKDGITWAYDDVNGSSLDPSLVQKARQLEMDYFRRMQVYERQATRSSELDG